MRETAADMGELQQLLDRSDASGGAHLRSIFDKTHRATATELVAKLDGVFEMHLATLTRDGAPLVAPIDGIFFHAKVFFSVPSAAVRSKVLRIDPRVSASYTDGSFAFIVHGTAVEITDDSETAQEFGDVARELYIAMYGKAWITFHEKRKRKMRGRDWTGYIEPRVMFAKR